MKKCFIPVILLLVFVQSSLSQEVKTGWERWDSMKGEWKGEGSGQP